MTALPTARCTRSSRARGYTLWRGPALNPDRRRARCRLARRVKRGPASGVAAASSASDAERLAVAAGGEVGFGRIVASETEVPIILVNLV